ncbi:cation:proton antiporter regulatory subunit [Haloarcula marina]|uniref:cation:proton antiporter regulatory subunit n=1 Tax=Haloarcula marina TaxID=2961574 RepID=UPI0020B826D0|nr:TrkA C-terminal domain-containing protein [Halomicroarcula marina]
MTLLLQGGLVLQGGSTTDVVVRLLAQLLGIGIAAAAAAAVVALAYRWYVRERVPSGLGILFGLSVVAVYLGTTGALGEVIGGQEDVLASSSVLPNLAAFAVGAAASSVGTRVGDRLGTDLFAAAGGRDVDADVSEIVQTVGRVTAVHLPEDIEDIVGYDPVPKATKETLSGRRFLFPRRLTKNELRDRLVTRLKTDYGVGHVDLELADNGTVEFLAVGSRAAGIGPTLPPATNAVAIRANPANAASSGDLVQVWASDPLQRVLTGELRGVVGDVVTVAIDAADTQKLDPATEYKLVTLPVQDRPDREFASLLRAADETMDTVTIEAGSALVGQSVGSLAVTVTAITREDAQPETIPSRDRVLRAGDVLYAIATPDALRRTEEAAVGSDAAAGDESDSPTVATDENNEPEEAESTTETRDAETPADDEQADPLAAIEDDDSDADDDDADVFDSLDIEGEPTDASLLDDETAPEPKDGVEIWDPDERVPDPDSGTEAEAEADGEADGSETNADDSGDEGEPTTNAEDDDDGPDEDADDGPDEDADDGPDEDADDGPDEDANGGPDADRDRE